MLGIRKWAQVSWALSPLSPLTFCFFVGRNRRVSVYFAQLGLQFVRVSSFHEAVLSPLGKEIRNFVSHHFLDNIKRFFCFFSKTDPSRLLFSSPFVYFPPPLGALPFCAISYLFCWQVSTSVRRGDVYNIFSF